MARPIPSLIALWLYTCIQVMVKTVMFNWSWSLTGLSCPAIVERFKFNFRAYVVFIHYTKHLVIQHEILTSVFIHTVNYETVYKVRSKYTLGAELHVSIFHVACSNYGHFWARRM